MKKIALMIIAALAAASCGKDDPAPRPAFLRIHNAVTDAPALVTDYGMDLSKMYYLDVNRLMYGIPSDHELTGYAAGTHQLRLFAFPDTGKAMAALQLELAAGQMQSVFVSGTKQHPDLLQVSEQLPWHRLADSTFGLRFMHLSAGLPDVKVEIDGKETAAGLAYRGYTGFQVMPANAAAGDMTVRFIIKTTGVEAARYTVAAPGSNVETNAWRNKNFTLALIGKAQGLSVMLIPHK
ncbi:DUF4397 domain-containing protein [Chitinophaga rhizosphaerae]|uniref:DUF4397 domain-containing protein n=1 Tax=Chitinophaga rhizosphaerae TaxID=1864947 RepID=UPI000F80A0BD|nr:DUF4397 domain-containing protein [Chitinophaga rhizosphaerae]